MVVNINQVSTTAYAAQWEIRRMVAVLEKQGQIEPLQVHATNDGYITFDNDVWGNAIVMAARALGWTTLLIVLMPRYKE